MLSARMNEANGVALFELDGPISKSDLKSAMQVVDPWIERKGKLKGLLIYAKSFPGWESLGALSSHLAFIKEHHKKIERVALVTDSVIVGAAEKIACHFANAEIKLFPYKSLEEAKTWLSEDGVVNSLTN